MYKVRDKLDVETNYTARGGNVPEYKGAERVFTHYYNLTYKVTSKVMLRYLEMVSTKKLNWLLAKVIVSTYLIPHVIISIYNLDLNKHFQFPFVAYVQVSMYNNPTGKNSPRTLNEIYLLSQDNKQ